VAAKSGTGPTLGARDGLAPLRTQSALSGGFASLAGILGGMGASANGSGPSGDAKTLARLPHRGETPLLWHVDADARGPKVAFSGRVPRAIIEDIVAMAASHAAGTLMMNK
jgi:hypothetical protein